MCNVARSLAGKSTEDTPPPEAFAWTFYMKNRLTIHALTRQLKITSTIPPMMDNNIRSPGFIFLSYRFLRGPVSQEKVGNHPGNHPALPQKYREDRNAKQQNAQKDDAYYGEEFRAAPAIPLSAILHFFSCLCFVLRFIHGCLLERGSCRVFIPLSVPEAPRLTGPAFFLASLPRAPHPAGVNYGQYNSGTTRSSVLAAIRDPGNQSAWERFFDQYAGYIYALAIRRGLRHADAEDVVQTVLVEVADKIRSFEYSREKGHFHTWLANAALFRIRDLQRANARRNAALPSGPLPDDAAPADAFAAMAEEEWLDLLRQRALERLRSEISLRQFELFHASVIAEWPTEKVMQVYGASRDAVYQARHRAIPAYRAALLAVQAELDEPPSIPPAPRP